MTKFSPTACCCLVFFINVCRFAINTSFVHTLSRHLTSYLSFTSKHVINHMCVFVTLFTLLTASIMNTSGSNYIVFLVSGELPHKYKIVIAGNHDFSLEESVFNKESGRDYLKERFQLKINHMLSYMAAKGVTTAKDLLTNAIYLQDSEVTVYGIRLYGSPW